MTMGMDIYLTIGVIFLAYITALIVQRIGDKENLIQAFSGGTIGWFIIFIVAFFIELPIICALLSAVIVAALVQYVLLIKEEGNISVKG